MATVYFGPYYNINKGGIYTADRVVLRYMLKSGLTDSETPKVTIYGTKYDATDRILCTEIQVRDSGVSEGIGTVDTFKLEDDTLFSIIVKIDEYESFERLEGLDITHKEKMDISIRKKTNG